MAAAAPRGTCTWEASDDQYQGESQAQSLGDKGPSPPFIKLANIVVQFLVEAASSGRGVGECTAFCRRRKGYLDALRLCCKPARTEPGEELDQADPSHRLGSRNRKLRGYCPIGSCRRSRSRPLFSVAGVLVRLRPLRPARTHWRRGRQRPGRPVWLRIRFQRWRRLHLGIRPVRPVGFS